MSSWWPMESYSIAPGPIETGMLVRGPAYNDEWLAAHVPLGRWGRATEVAACVALLTGDDGGAGIGREGPLQRRSSPLRLRPRSSPMLLPLRLRQAPMRRRSSLRCRRPRSRLLR